MGVSCVYFTVIYLYSSAQGDSVLSTELQLKTDWVQFLCVTLGGSRARRMMQKKPTEGQVK